ncbi:MAG: acetate--CoA ligase family protein [Thermodesulfobacteriota bacterium]
MNDVQSILAEAQGRGQKALSEYDSKRILGAYGIPVVKESLVNDLNEAKEAASGIGYPVVLKFCSAEVTHKTEKGLIEVGLRDSRDLTRAFKALQKRAKGLDGGFLVQEMVKGVRELVIGMIRDPQFGPCVMFGLGGIFTEILRDVSFRVAPIEKRDAMEMMREIKGQKILDAIRGMEAVDLEVLSRSLIALGNLGLEQDAIQEVDVNPLIVRGSQPVAVDALVVLRDVKQESP